MILALPERSMRGHVPLMASRTQQTPVQLEKLMLRKRYGLALAIVRDAHDHTQDTASLAHQPVMTSQNWGRYETGMAAGITDPVVRRNLLSAIGADEEEFQATLSVLREEDIPAGGKGRSMGARMSRMASAITAGTPAVTGEQRQAIFPLREGEVIITFPRHLTAEGRREMKRYLELLLESTDDAQ